MAKKEKKRAETFETFYFTVDDWAFEYSIGIRPKSLTRSGERSLSEHEVLRIVGRLRSRSKRKIETGGLYLLGDRDFDKIRWTSDVEEFAGAQVRSRHLECLCGISPPILRGLAPALAAGKIQEFNMCIRNLRYNNGGVHAFRVNRDLTDLSDDGEKERELSQAPITVQEVRYL